MESSNLLMDQFLKEIFKIMRLTERAHIYGVMEKFIRETGKLIKCMERVFYNGKMGNNIKETLKMIGGMVMVSSLGRMADLMMVLGRMENSMGGEFLNKLMVKSLLGNGVKARESDG